MNPKGGGNVRNPDFRCAWRGSVSTIIILYNDSNVSNVVFTNNVGAPRLQAPVPYIPVTGGVVPTVVSGRVLYCDEGKISLYVHRDSCFTNNSVIKSGAHFETALSN